MNYQCFDIELLSHVAHVRLSRPEKRNSMIPAFWQELPSLIKELDNSGNVRAIVLSSTGPHFSSGMDVSVFSGNTPPDGESKLSQGQRSALFYDVVKRLQQSFSAIEEARVPVLAAVQGGCIGAGVDLTSACDMRYATQDAFFTIFETNLAMTADVGTFPRICKLMPEGIVRELAYTGRNMQADEAKSHGLVNQVFDTQEKMLEHVLATAQIIAEKAPLAVHGCKKMITHARDHSVADTLDYVALWNASFFQKHEIAEAMQAQAEKRTGNFDSLPARVADHEDTLEIP